MVNLLINFKNMSDDFIKSKFSNTIFVFDEAHNIHTLDDDAEKIKNNANIKKEIMRLTHLIEKSKIILVTATPIINFPKDFSTLINLFRPLNDQMPKKKIIILSKKLNHMLEGKFHILKQNCLTLILYMRVLNII